jgi:carbonic anhydrase/acetyltransferase-like protein (isoleucine patch superfamily)
MGAVVLDGAVVEEKSMVAAGTLIKPGFVVPSGKLAAGVPAIIVRNLSEDEMLEFEKSASRYVEYTKLTIDSLQKNNYQTKW